MTRPIPMAVATAVLALGSLCVYAADSEGQSETAETESKYAYHDVVLPRFTPSSEELYPAAASRKLLQGSVGVEFQIDAEGRARVLSQTFVDAPEFAASASEVLERGRFDVPADWVKAGGPAQHFVIEVQFNIARGDAPCTKRPPHVADTEVISVCWQQPTRRRSRL
jgi:TonB family protein